MSEQAFELCARLCPNGRLELPQERHLSDLGGTGDQLIYRAYRDVLTPRPAASDDGRSVLWCADLVQYEAGPLPGGERVRSLGHWNPEDEVEVFEVLHGHVVMLLAGRTPAREYYLGVVELGAGERCVAPPGAWHLTYVLDGPAVVFNMYTRSARDGGPPARQPGKYTWRPPLGVRLAGEDGGRGWSLAASDDSCDWLRLEPAGARLREGSADLVPVPLSEWFDACAAFELTGLEARIRQAWRAGWPAGVGVTGRPAGAG